MEITKYTPQTGDIIFFRTQFKIEKPISWLSTAIRPIADIKYNHVEIVGENWGQFYSFGAINNGFLPRPLLDTIDGKDILIKRPNFEIDIKAFNIKLNDLTSTKYDFKGLLYSQLILNVFHRWKGAKTESEALERLYCYESYWYMFKEQLEKELNQKWWELYPKDTINTNFTKTVFKGKYI